jgi:DNA-binding CsgD family transcriptional regulator
VGEEWAAQVLAEAGRRALARAAPESAAAFYERALAEPPASVPRDQLLLGRARALLMAGRDDGFPAFREAIAAIPDARDKALIALEMGDALITVDRTLEAQDAYASGVEAIGDRDEPLRIHMLAQAALASLATRGQGERAMAAVVAALEASGRSPELTSRAALALPALVATWTGQPAADCVAMLQRALNAQTYGERPALEWSPDLGWTMASLTWCDAFGHAEPFLDAVIERAQRRVALVDLAVASTWRAYGCLRQGRLAEVERDIAAAAQIYGDIDEAEHALVSALHLDLLVARGHIEPAERVLAQLHVNPEADEIVHLAFLDARARMRIAQGRIAQARQDLEVIAGDISERGFECPGAIPWRSSLAVALHGLGEVEQARALAREDVERCRTFGAPRALGLALLGMGAVADEQEALAALRESVEVLAPSPARLDHARALTALGSCLRRVGQREEALGLLRDALQLASECSADALVLHTQSELKALGTRPRRGWVSGPAALTAAERRVAALAAAGASNGEIAQELVVTLRTVETHLTSIYRKLEIRGRARLAEALEHDGAGAELATSRTGGPSGFTDGRA